MRLLLCAILCVACIAVSMLWQGKVYTNKIRACRRATGFCGLQTIPLHLPGSLRECLERASRQATRVTVGPWKRGSTLPTRDLARLCPEALEWYRTIARDAVSRTVGEPVVPTPLDLPTSSCLLVYDRPGDTIGWHFDVNYYRGRFFTVLVPVTPDTTATTYVYRDPWSRTRSVRLVDGRALLFEGDRVFHAATPLGRGERRVVLSLQFATDTAISPWNRILRRLKDVAYIGV